MLHNKIHQQIKEKLFKTILIDNYNCKSHISFLTTTLIYSKLFRYFQLQSKNTDHNKTKIVSKLNILKGV